MAKAPKPQQRAEPLAEAELDAATGGGDVTARRTEDTAQAITPDQKTIIGGFKSVSGMD